MRQKQLRKQKKLMEAGRDAERIRKQAETEAAAAREARERFENTRRDLTAALARLADTREENAKLIRAVLLAEKNEHKLRLKAEVLAHQVIDSGKQVATLEQELDQLRAEDHDAHKLRTRLRAKAQELEEARSKANKANNKMNALLATTHKDDMEKFHHLSREIDRLHVEKQELIKSINSRNAIIFALYDALDWASTADDFKEGEEHEDGQCSPPGAKHEDWLKKVKPLIDKLEPIIEEAQEAARKEAMAKAAKEAEAAAKDKPKEPPAPPDAPKETIVTEDGVMEDVTDDPYGFEAEDEGESPQEAQA